MMREAEAHADEDKKRREEIEVRNKADQAVYGAERMIKDSGDKLTASDREAIETAMASVRSAIEANDPAAIQRALDQLTSAQHKAAETLYKQTQGGAAGTPPGGSDQTDQTGQPGAASGSGAKSEVIDAEVVDEGKQ
jgi:molecular chaperone DnaK